jgi:hypothetical protein
VNSDVVSDRKSDAKKVQLLAVEKSLFFVKRDAFFPAPSVHLAPLESFRDMWDQSVNDTPHTVATS